ncbi:uncharacterized protein LOC127006439 [Eriocheir sinensis]|uniref:uncharacterized protein LOC127006439 n=1 Tax=Eriocheir sinensis TaxID=95602 RepID=UPI0021C96D22|nr:uncharacterized protein LOC127006439 [Eriocheir sinensis]
MFKLMPSAPEPRRPERGGVKGALLSVYYDPFKCWCVVPPRPPTPTPPPPRPHTPQHTPTPPQCACACVCARLCSSTRPLTPLNHIDKTAPIHHPHLHHSPHHAHHSPPAAAAPLPHADPYRRPRHSTH